MVLPMDWTWFLLGFDGRINRAKIWFAALIWFATVFSFMTIFMIFLFVLGSVLRGFGYDVHLESTKTMHPAFYLLGLPLLVTFVWLFAATVVKRLHDRAKSAWWFVPFFMAPSLLEKLSDWLEIAPLAVLASTLSFGLSVWCFVELFCLKGTKGPNRFGADPLAPATPPATPVDMRPGWDQRSELEFVPHSAGPSAGPHVNRGP
jgi:uncharacterized membrane protein YhaH (DUF805 family)